NLAWTYAKGEFIAFLDADDIWLPRKLEKQLVGIRTDEKLAFVYTDVEEFNAKGILRPCIYAEYEENWTSADQFERTLSGQMPIYASTVLIRRSLAERVGKFEDSLILGDTHYLLRLAQQHPCQVIFEPLVRIRKHDHNISVYKEREAYIEMLSLLAVFEREQSLERSEIHKYKAFYYRQLAQFDRRQGKWLLALKAYGNTLLYRLLMQI
ncbi:glycosyltransferase, partial [Okeania hirsuta]